MSNGVLVKLVNVTKHLWGYPVLAGINLEALVGNFIAVINPGGNYMLSKTVLLEIMAGLLRADGGSVMILGVDLMREFNKAVKLRRRDLAIVFRDPGITLIMTLTNLENIMLPLLQLGMKKDEAKAIALSIAKNLGLSEEILYKSTGKTDTNQRRIVAIARALALKPKVLIIDEPTISRNKEASETILINLRKFADDNKATVIVAHDKTALPYADKQYILANGKLMTVP